MAARKTSLARRLYLLEPGGGDDHQHPPERRVGYGSICRHHDNHRGVVRNIWNHDAGSAGCAADDHDDSLPNGAINAAYSATLAATGGTLPYTWSILAGSIPPGLTLNPNTGAITGTPTAIGTFSLHRNRDRCR